MPAGDEPLRSGQATPMESGAAARSNTGDVSSCAFAAAMDRGAACGPATTLAQLPHRMQQPMRAWLAGALRSAVGVSPRHTLPRPGPFAILLLMAASLLLALAMERLAVDGPASFDASALQSGWFSSLVLAWLCWAVLRDASPRPEGAQRDVPTLYGLLLAQALVILAIGGLGTLALYRSGLVSALSPAWLEFLGWAPFGWSWLANLMLFRRQVPRRSPLAALAFVVVSSSYAFDLQMPKHSFWLPARDADATERHLQLSPQIIETQVGLLPAALATLAPQRPGVVDLYAITFAPYADEDVFRRESAMVDALMQQRFDASGRSLQLVNHPRTADILPWATAANLERAIKALAAVMDRDEDVLFIHLTSHGARNGELAAALWPLQVAPLTPERLRGWLDAAGLRFRVLSVSACYSGTWLAPLSDDGSLVMTAADAEHTSYGCGRKSELTFFGRAMYDEALRGTFSFERAHAQARTAIERREREAGKDDGYSNPQIAIGAAVRAPLAALEARLETESRAGGYLQSLASPRGKPDSYR